jgi:hypothetical protein
VASCNSPRETYSDFKIFGNTEKLRGPQVFHYNICTGKEVNRSTRRDYRAYVDSIANEAQTAANQGNIKGMFNSIRRLTNNVRPTTALIRDKEGKTITSIEGQI